MYSNTSACVCIKGIESEWCNCNSGVRQVVVLSTTLFSIFINDLDREIKDLNIGIPVKDILIAILLYGDDIVLY